MKRFLGSVFILAVFVAMNALGAASRTFGFEAKKVEVTATRPALDALTFGAVNFMGRDGAASYSLVAAGEPGEPLEGVIDGTNYDLTATATGADDQAGIATDQVVGTITASNLVVTGDPSGQLGGVASIDVFEMVEWYRDRADIIFTGDTTYNGGSIGSAGNYQIVFVDDATLTLAEDFAGFGVLAIWDRSGDGTTPRLVMHNTATWTGLVVVYQDSTVASQVTRVTLEGRMEILMQDYALLGLSDLIIGTGAIINGDIGIANAGNTLTVENGAVINGSVLADSVYLEENVIINEDVHSNNLTVDNNVTVVGTVYPSLDFSDVALPPYPVFSAGAPGDDIINTANGAIESAAAGSYDEIRMGNNATLYLTGGDIYIRRLQMGQNSTVYYTAATNLYVAEDIDVTNGFSLIEGAAGLGPKDMMIYITGTFDCTFNNPVVHANIYIPNGSIVVGNGADFQGAVIANVVDFSNNLATAVNGDSAFIGGRAEERPMILGAVLLSGSTMHLPNTETFFDVFYSEQALDACEALIDDRAYAWRDWREAE
ncbi:MAG: hypothetical protein JW937_05000 [Candidatus Omnitrophica bacterium]|nr:hypothetical protein [Candidatus Omnitrophota bacterium]